MVILPPTALPVKISREENNIPLSYSLFFFFVKTNRGWDFRGQATRPSTRKRKHCFFLLSSLIHQGNPCRACHWKGAVWRFLGRCSQGLFPRYSKFYQWFAPPLSLSLIFLMKLLAQTCGRTEKNKKQKQKNKKTKKNGTFSFSFLLFVLVNIILMRYKFCLSSLISISISFLYNLV